MGDNKSKECETKLVTACGKPFVGEGRRLIVQGLGERFNSLLKPHWVHIEAPSGWGKSHLLKALYEELAATQNEPQYWPVTIDPPLPTNPRQRVEAIQANRKRIFPASVRREPYALPSYFWWGVQCLDNGTGLKSQVENFIDVFGEHSPYIRLRAEASMPISGRIRSEADKALRDLSAMGADEAVGKVVEAVEDLVPGSGLIVKVAKGTARRINGFKAARETQRTQALIQYENEKQLIDDAAELINAVAATIPVLMVVEDLQLADNSVMQLLGKLIASNRQILIITTAEPGCLAGNDALKAGTRGYPEMFEFITDDMTLGPNWPEEASLGPLDHAAIAELVSFHRPDATAKALKAAFEKVRSPLAAELVASEVPDIGQVTTEGWEFPDGVSGELLGLLRRLWDRLDPAARRALGCAAAAVPARLSIRANDHRLDLDLVRASVSKVNTELAADLDASRAAWGGWLHMDGTGLASFVEHGMADQAADGLRPGEVSALLVRLAKCALEGGAVTPDAQVHRVTLLIALASYGIQMDRTQAVERAAEAYTAAASAYPYRYSELIGRLLDDVAALAGDNLDPRTSVVVHKAAAKICSNRDFHRAADHLLQAANAELDFDRPDWKSYVDLLLQLNDIFNIESEADAAEAVLDRICYVTGEHPYIVDEMMRVKLNLATFDTAKYTKKDPYLLLSVLPDALELGKTEGGYAVGCLQQLAGYVAGKGVSGKFASAARGRILKDCRRAAEELIDAVVDIDNKDQSFLLGCLVRILFYTGSPRYAEAREKWQNAARADFYDASAIAAFMMEIGEPKKALDAAKDMHERIAHNVMVLDHEKAQIALQYATAIVGADDSSEMQGLPKLEEAIGKLLATGDIDEHHLHIVEDLAWAHLQAVAEHAGACKETVLATLQRLRLPM